MDFHSKYHKNVEPGTLTPFASRARDTGLFGMLVAFARIYASKQNNCITLVEDPSKFTKKNNGLANLLNEMKKELEKLIKKSKIYNLQFQSFDDFIK